MQALNHFPLLPPSERLAYEQLSEANAHVLVALFENDENPFVDKRFKNIEEAKEYAFESNWSVHLPKYGSCDFLVQQKSNGNYIGILHLFDLSLETFNENHLRATIGFALAAPFRRQYFATEAANHLINYVQNTLKRPYILAYTHPENEVANDFMISLGMVLNTEDYIFGYNYYELK
jgi:RimJ/RimL family protein N-acetyltransferase